LTSSFLPLNVRFIQLAVALISINQTKSVHPQKLLQAFAFILGVCAGFRVECFDFLPDSRVLHLPKRLTTIPLAAVHMHFSSMAAFDGTGSTTGYGQQ